MTPRAAEQVATAFLHWLVQDPERLHGFMTTTGASADDLRRGLDDSALALAALDHLMSDEPLLLMACQALDLPPETPARAQIALGGGPGMNWT
jgi:hypothetical protein